MSKDSKERKKRGQDDKRQSIIKLEEFDRLVKRNKLSDRNWYRGLEGKWWWGMSEEDARSHIKRFEDEANRIVLISTWDVMCGIASYTKYLLDSLNKVSPSPDSFTVNPIEKALRNKTKGKLIHLQHEFGIVHEPKLLKIKGKLIVTWHTVSKNTNAVVKKLESNCNVVAHIVHTECARYDIDSSRDILSIPHGSVLIPDMKKEEARRLIGIDMNIPENVHIGFAFGFQSGDKNYQRLIEAAKETSIHIIISGASHRNGYMTEGIQNDQNVTFLNRYLNENEVNLYALASDILLFDYNGKNHYSVSGALHRVIGAGRPVICSDVRHFIDVRHGVECLKFNSQSRLEDCIRRALRDGDKLGIAARKYSENTSWENVARRHLEIYDIYL